MKPLFGGVAIRIDPLIPPGDIINMGGVVYFHSRAGMEQTLATCNKRYRLRRPTRAMLGNTRRRALLAQIRERTVSNYPRGEGCAGCELFTVIRDVEDVPLCWDCWTACCEETSP